MQSTESSEREKELIFQAATTSGCNFLQRCATRLWEYGNCQILLLLRWSTAQRFLPAPLNNKGKGPNLNLQPEQRRTARKNRAAALSTTARNTRSDIRSVLLFIWFQDLNFVARNDMRK